MSLRQLVWRGLFPRASFLFSSSIFEFLLFLSLDLVPVLLRFFVLLKCAKEMWIVRWCAIGFLVEVLLTECKSVIVFELVVTLLYKLILSFLLLFYGKSVLLLKDVRNSLHRDHSTRFSKFAEW